jgi:hypothetical protein
MALIATLRHYLGDDLSLIKIPAPAAALREFLGCIVEAVTARDPGDEDYGTELSCRQGCEICESIMLAFHDKTDPSVICWTCSTCGDEGQITGWEGTIWDKRRKSQ